MPDQDDVIRLTVRFNEGDVEREAQRAQDALNAKMAGKTQAAPTALPPAVSAQHQVQAANIAAQVAPPGTPANAAARTQALRTLQTGGSIAQAQTAAVIASHRNQGQSTVAPAGTGAAGGGFGGLVPNFGVPTGIGAAAFGFAGSGGAGGGLGFLVGVSGRAGMIGLAAIALKELTEAAESAARGLANYSGDLFSAVSGLDLLFEGLKFQLARDIGPGLVRIIRDIGALAVAMEPLIAKTINFVVEILDPILKGLAKVPAALALWWDAIILEVEILKSIPAVIKSLIGGNGLSISAGVLSALAELSKDMKRLAETGQDLNDQMNKLMGDGMSIVTGLFRTMENWSHQAGKDEIRGGFGPLPLQAPQITPSVQRALARPDRPNMGAAANWVAQHAPNMASPAGNITPTGMPRPTPAAMHLHTADSVTVNASDYDRLHSELMMVVDRVYAEMRGMQDGRWIRIAMARLKTMPRGLVGGAA